MSLIETDKLIKAIKELEYERKTDYIKEYMVLREVLAYTYPEPLYVKKIKVDGSKSYRPAKCWSWDDVARNYVAICKIVREFFGARFDVGKEVHP